jgi:hypothetical protein
MRHRRSWLIFPALFLGACAGPVQETRADKEPVASTQSPVVPEGSVASNDNLVCATEMPTGSKIPKQRCRTHAQMDEDRRQAEELIRRSQQMPQGDRK